MVTRQRADTEGGTHSRMAEAGGFGCGGSIG